MRQLRGIEPTSLDEIEEQYGQDKADKLRITVEQGSTLGTDSVEYEENRYGDTAASVEYNQNSSTNPVPSRAGPIDTHRHTPQIHTLP